MIVDKNAIKAKFVSLKVVSLMRTKLSFVLLKSVLVSGLCEKISWQQLK